MNSEQSLFASLRKIFNPVSVMGFAISGVLLWLLLKQSKLEMVQVWDLAHNKQTALYLIAAILLCLLHNLKVHNCLKLTREINKRADFFA